MNTKNSLMLILPALALWGCGNEGGGGSEPASSTNYNFDFVSLYETEVDNLPSRCAIYSQEALYETDGDSDDSSISGYRVVLASLSEQSNLKVLIHDSAGRVLREYTPTSTSSWTDEHLRFPQSQVPSDGYVTISSQYVIPGTSNIVSVNAVTYQKPMLSSSMRFSTLNAPRSTNINSCIEESRTTLNKRTQTINDDGLGFGVFGFNTPESNFWSLSPQNVSFESSDSSVLAMRYQFLDGDTRENINSDERADLVRQVDGYRMRSTSQLGNSPLDLRSEGYLSEASWRYDDLNANLSQAQLWVRYNSRAYFWQNLPMSDDSFNYATEFGRSYVLKTKGDAFGWNVVHNTRLDGNGDWNQTPENDINYSDVMSNLTMPTSSSAEIVPCGACESGYALRAYTGAAGSEYSVQRSFILMERQGQSIRQVVYSRPSSQVVLPDYDDTLINSLWSSDMTLAQVSLLEGTTVVQDAFVRSHSDALRQTYGNSQYYENPDIDAMGEMASLDTKQKDDARIGTENYIILTK